jgi:hypothetical protein
VSAVSLVATIQLFPRLPSPVDFNPVPLVEAVVAAFGLG